MCCLESVPFSGEKLFQAKLTKQDLGSFGVLFKIFDQHPDPFHGSLPPGFLLLVFSAFNW